MKDRVSTYPGRVRLIPVSGQTNVYDVERADSPTEVGTGLVKANLLTDETAESLGLDPEDNPTINDAFARIKELIGQGGGGGGGGDYSGAVIGDVVYSSTRPSPGTDWLQCNGDSISADDYPDLAAYLNSTNPGGYTVTRIAKTDIGTTISNGVVYNGRYWVYSHDYNSANVLHGFSLSGETKKEIQVTSNESSFNNLAPRYSNPIALSIVGGKLFISQIRSNNISDGLTLLTSSFTGNENSITLQNVFSGYGSGAVYGSRGNVIPYVVKYGQNFYMCVGPDPGKTVSYWFWKDGDSSPQISTINLSPNNYGTGTYNTVTGGYGKFAFNSKNQGELYAVQLNTQRDLSAQRVYSSVASSPQGTYTDSITRATSTYVEKFGYSGRTNSNITPVIGSGNIAIVDIGNENGYVKLNTCESGYAGYTNVGTKYVPNNAYNKFFPDAANYFEVDDVWIIFIGRGFIFTKDLKDETYFGFADTSSYIGLITSSGHLELDSGDPNKFYISGCNMDGEFVLASVDIEYFSGSSENPYLPYLYKDGVPGYIRALVNGENPSGA